MTKANIIKYSMLAVASIALIILVAFIFIRKEKKIEQYKNEITLRDSMIAFKEETIRAIQEVNTQLDKNIALHKERDSILKVRGNTLITKYERIPVIVRDYSDQQLRDSAIAKYNSPN